jgi:hypothetical protein
LNLFIILTSESFFKSFRSSATNKNLSNLEIKFNFIPEKSIVNDLKNAIPFVHNFSNLCEEKVLKPNVLIEPHQINSSNIKLYSGEITKGYYHKVCYNITELKYIYFVKENVQTLTHALYYTESWDNLHKYVTDYCERLIKPNSV